MFTKATKKEAKLRLALEGVAGTGKTRSALEIMKVILDKMAKLGQPLGNGRAALIDSEHGSAALYADMFDFDHAALEEFSLATYMKAIQAAKESGYPVLGIDSMSHAWTGKGGALEQVDKMGGSKFTNGWRHVTPLQNQFINTILAYPGHVIATMRTKAEFALEKNENTGKIEPKKLGLAPVQRDGVDYEFGVVVDLHQGGVGTITKSRCSTFPPGTVLRWDDMPAFAAGLMDWLAAGAPLTAKDKLEEEIRFAASKDMLMELIPRLKQLSEADAAALREPFSKRMAEFVPTVTAEMS